MDDQAREALRERRERAAQEYHNRRGAKASQFSERTRGKFSVSIVLANILATVGWIFVVGGVLLAAWSALVLVTGEAGVQKLFTLYAIVIGVIMAGTGLFFVVASESTKVQFAIEENTHLTQVQMLALAEGGYGDRLRGGEAHG